MSRTLLNSVSFLIILATFDSTTSNDVDGYVYYSDIDTSLKFHNDGVGWWMARATCNAEGARLAVIDTWAKVERVNALKPVLVWAWVGINRLGSEFVWADIEDRIISEGLPWALWNPKPFSGHCLAVTGTHWARGLSNWNCDLRKAFVCEKLGV